ncbi:MAG TPA: hypothetical protein VFQ61_37965 [Polyangiaceae bacterium]|nr:hypothetical protein [Polyangiaceae bacterium]
MNTLFALRLALLATFALGIALIMLRPEQAWQKAREFLLEPTHPANLGLLRAVVFGTVFYDACHSQAWWYATLPKEFVSPPRGWEWLGAWFESWLPYVKPAQTLLCVCAALASLGVLARVTTKLAAILAVLVLGVPAFFFKVSHGLHMPVLLALVLASSRAGDGLAIDVWIRQYRGQPAPSPGPAYTIPVRLCWLILGTMYLFPGVWKLWDTGDQWLNGTKLQVEMAKKWAQSPEFVPALRVDHSKWLLAIGGAFTLIFEIGFFFAILWRPTRLLGALAAALFHTGVGLTMGIWFSVFFPLIVFIDFPAVLRLWPFRYAAPILIAAFETARRRLSLRPQPAPALDSNRSHYSASAPPLLVGLLLLTSMLYAGLVPVDSWPISVYPLFNSRVGKAPERGSWLEFALSGPDEQRRELGRLTFAHLQDNAEAYRIAREVAPGFDPKYRPKKMSEEDKQRYIDLIARFVRESVGETGDAETLLIYRREFLLDPELRGTRSFARDLVAEVPLQ